MRRIKFWHELTAKYIVGEVYKEDLYRMWVKCGTRKYIVNIQDKWQEI